MSFGFGLCLPSLNYVASLFSPLSLFANGEQGAWYDPSDLTTLFQDSAGTTPVTAVEQPVGLMLDKSKGLVMGPELVVSQDLTNAQWAQLPATPASTTTATTLTFGGQFSGRADTISVTSGKTYLFSFEVRRVSGNTNLRIYYDSIQQTNGAVDFTVDGNWKTVSRVVFATSTLVDFGWQDRNASGHGTIELRNISVRELPGNHAFQSTSASRPVLSARVNLLTATNVLSTQSVTTVATTYKLFFAGTGAITLTGTATGVYTAGTYTVTCTAGTLIATVAGLVTQADLRVSNDDVGIPAYQRVNTSTDYDTAGFPLYLKTDGVDDWMRTNSINFTSTDKMTVWAGVRKLSDAAAGMFLELSASVGVNNGTFYISAPETGATYGIRTRGTVDATGYNHATFTAPLTNVLVTSLNNGGSGGTATNCVASRFNGVANTTGGTSSVTTAGNFGNYPLYLFRRGGTSLPFNGRMYGLILRGAQSTASQIASGETYMNNLTKAYA